LPYCDLDRVIIRLLQNKLDGSGWNKPEDVLVLSDQIAGELNLPPQKILHVATQLSGTNFKRNWPKVVTRKEAGLADIETIRIN
jgi:hypothetical protein